MSELFSEHPFYFIMAAVGTTLYILKMLLFFVTGDSDGDIDTTSDFDGGDNFSVISTQSILAFLMGAGWIGLAAKKDWMLNDTYALAAAVGFGIVMMFFSAYLTFKIQKFNHTPTIDPKSAKGEIGRAYTNIPAKGEGSGQIEVSFGGKQQIVNASSTGEMIKAFQPIVVVKVDDSGNFFVKINS